MQENLNDGTLVRLGDKEISWVDSNCKKNIWLNNKTFSPVLSSISLAAAQVLLSLLTFSIFYQWPKKSGQWTNWCAQYKAKQTKNKKQGADIFNKLDPNSDFLSSIARYTCMYFVAGSLTICKCDFIIHLLQCLHWIKFLPLRIFINNFCGVVWGEGVRLQWHPGMFGGHEGGGQLTSSADQFTSFYSCYWNRKAVQNRHSNDCNCCTMSLFIERSLWSSI